MKKIFSAILIVFLILISFNVEPVNAFGNGFNQGNIPSGGSTTNMSKLKNPIAEIAGTIFLLLQIASVAGVIALGVKYMYGSAEQKADYKKSLLPVLVGIVLVFGASTVASFVVKAFTEATNI